MRICSWWTVHAVSLTSDAIDRNDDDDDDDDDDGDDDGDDDNDDDIGEDDVDREYSLSVLVLMLFSNLN